MAVNGFVHLTHPDLDGDGALVPDDTSVVEHYVARGWVVSPEVPAHLDPDAPNLGTVASAPAPADEAPAPVEAPAPKVPAPPVKDKSAATPAAEQNGE